MSALCREFGISRVTGYKVYNRYKDCGLDGLRDRSRRPNRHANKAHLQVIRVENTLNQWYKAGNAPSTEAMNSALRAIDRAIALHTDNPYQLTLKARLLEWRGYSAGEGDAASADFRTALVLHRQAAALRPLWPDTWAEMVGLKLQLNELDEELEFFLQQADKLGPYTAPVHTAVVRASFAKLERYPFQQLPLLQKHLLRGLSDPRTKGQLLNLVRQYGQEATTCRWLAQAPGAKPNTELCGQRKL